VPTPSGRHILVVDLGGDRIHRFTPDPTTRSFSEEGETVVLPPGTGPRHAVFSVDGRELYVVGELDGRLHTIAWDSGRDAGCHVGSVRLHSPASGGPQPAHISRDGQEVTVTCRGSERVVVHQVGGATPRLAREFRLPGRWPRHHARIDGWLLVAQQHEGGVVVLDAHGRVRGEAAVPAPACVLPGPIVEGNPR
jgi:6-phosphogluconolactonase (cycloisomerase 2 family)